MAIATTRIDATTGPALAHELVAAVRRLAGRALDLDAIVVDAPGRAAWGSLDGVRLRWRRAQLAVVRPCAHCGHGAFASGPIGTMQDIFSAVGEWRPLHRDCRPFEADDSL
jgi:hypothetical protein